MTSSAGRPATPLAFGLVFIIPAVAALGLALGGLLPLLTAALVFVLVPVADALAPPALGNPEGDAVPARWAFDAWLVLWVPAQLGLIGYGLVLTAGGARTPAELLAAALAVGLATGGGGITIAHELMHRRAAWARALAEVLMTSVTYPHFQVEHVLGHHRNVATPRDPASSRRGEGLYAFLPRTLVGGLVSAWRLEARRCRNLGLRRWSLADRRLRYALGLAATYAAVGALFGPAGVAFFAAQSVVAVLLLETINYVEHYGLARREVSPGRFERVRPAHSWNSPHRVSGLLLFNLPRHADHHYLASRPYPILRHMADSPQLPAGYAGMVLLALAPPLWRRVMDPRVDAWNGAQQSPGQTAFESLA
ncbi:MAG: alkane 1-monooxygenase [Deltaproteobacteria bacterium]|nr:alkane 1-monooxygenase [Deltaproteobacteria bacterium]